MFFYSFSFLRAKGAEKASLAHFFICRKRAT